MIGPILAAMLQAAGPPTVADPAAPPSVTTNPMMLPRFTQPHWVKRPQEKDVLKVFPKKALRLGHDGRATLHCRVTQDGALTACSVQEEMPVGEGFGESALNLATKYRMLPQTADGRSVEIFTVRLPMRFDNPANDPSRPITAR